MGGGPFCECTFNQSPSIVSKMGLSTSYAACRELPFQSCRLRIAVEPKRLGSKGCGILSSRYLEFTWRPRVLIIDLAIILLGRIEVCSWLTSAITYFVDKRTLGL